MPGHSVVIIFGMIRKYRISCPLQNVTYFVKWQFNQENNTWRSQLTPPLKKQANKQIKTTTKFFFCKDPVILMETNCEVA